MDHIAQLQKQYLHREKKPVEQNNILLAWNHIGAPHVNLNIFLQYILYNIQGKR